jgi:hypothetical protein
MIHNISLDHVNKLVSTYEIVPTKGIRKMGFRCNSFSEIALTFS